MALLRYVNIDLPESERLFDLSGMAIDMSGAIAACEQLSTDILNQFCKDFSISLFAQYGRCFKGGVRIKTSRELEAAILAEDRELHQFILNYRDKHVSHSVNEYENHRVRVWLNPEERGRAINAINIESTYLVGPGTIVADICSLCKRHLEWIEGEIRIEEAHLLEIVKNRFTLDDLYSLEASSAPPIAYENIAKRRSGR